MTDVSSQLPARVQGVELYDPLRPDVTYDLSDNTNQWPLAPEVQQLLTTGAVNFSRYPEVYGRTLKEKLVDLYRSDIADLDSTRVVVGCGTDDVMDCIVRACTNEGDVVVAPTPSFPMAGYFAKYNDRVLISVPLTEEGIFDISQCVNASLLYICSPNNPTGISVPSKFVASLIEKTTAFIVIDEAYAEFSNVDLLSFLDNPRVIVMRTFSKIYGLAGLRIGYALASAPVASAIEAVRGPYKANVLGLAAACASLDTREYYVSLLDEVRSTREWFIGGLIGMGYEPYMSDANFVFVPGNFSNDLKERLAEKDFSVRVFAEGDLYGIRGIRITLAPKNILQEFLNIFAQVQS